MHVHSYFRVIVIVLCSFNLLSSSSLRVVRPTTYEYPILARYGETLDQNLDEDLPVSKKFLLTGVVFLWPI